MPGLIFPPVAKGAMSIGHSIDVPCRRRHAERLRQCSCDLIGGRFTGNPDDDSTQAQGHD